MLLTDKKHYMRRDEQPLPLPRPSRIIVDCLLLWTAALSLSPHSSKAIMDCIFCHEILSSFGGGKQEEIQLQRKGVKRKRKAK